MVELMTNQKILRRIFSKKMLICIFLGFTSGLPLYLIYNLITAWLKDSGIDLTTIGLFSLVSVPYVWKFIWAPIVDRYDILKQGRRRSWMFLCQFMLLGLIAILGFFTPSEKSFVDFGLEVNNISVIVVLCFLISFFSATQDVTLDAYRREILEDEELGLGSSLFINSYRIAGMVPGGLALYLSDITTWKIVFIVTALFMVPGIVTTFLIREPKTQTTSKSFIEFVVAPFIEFIQRKKVLGALGVILFIFLYKLGDSMATALATPFYMEMGFSNTSIGIVNKSVGLWSLVIGGIVGGVIMLKIGINKALWWFGVGQIVTILGFVFIAHVWKHPTFCTDIVSSITDNEVIINLFKFPSHFLLSFVVGGESLAAGLGTSCFVAYMCRETKGEFVATQLALFTALSAIPRTFCTATTGYIVTYLGWENFFILCYALAIPGMLCLIWIAPYNKR